MFGNILHVRSCQTIVSLNKIAQLVNKLHASEALKLYYQYIPIGATNFND